MTKREQLQRDLDDVKSVMSTISGRRFIWRQLEKAGIFRTSFTGETNSTMFREGHRNAGLTLFNSILANCPALYLTMAQEASKEQPKPHKTTEDYHEQYNKSDAQ